MKKSDWNIWRMYAAKTEVAWMVLPATEDPNTTGFDGAELRAKLFSASEECAYRVLNNLRS